MPAYRVVSIDGGGIRGLVTTILLQRIVATPGLEDFLDSTDLIAGTSTGGILALGIAHKLELDRIRDIYVNKGPKIFDDSWLDDLVDPDNADSDPAKRTWKPKLFHNYPGPNNDRKSLAVDVALYTSAAPTYFPSVDGYIDGGVYANNPAMCALAQTRDGRYSPTPPIDEVLLLSLGTGTSLQYIKGKSHDWGYAQWVKPLISLMLDGTAGIAERTQRKIFTIPIKHLLQ